MKDLFSIGYVSALYFTECGPDSDFPDNAMLSPDTLNSIMSDCEAFMRVASDLLTKAYNEEYNARQAGIDFWLTRNGHGAGFWDRDELSNGLGDALTTIAQSFQPCDVYLGDDGFLYT